MLAEGIIRPACDNQGNQAFSGTFDLAGFFRATTLSANALAMDSPEVATMGWGLVQALLEESPETPPWTSYRIYAGKLTVTSHRREDVAKSLERLVVLANLKALSMSLGINL